ncbi:MAG: AraC family transcriptional regulator ligand-binding domain-containing protein [Xanthobacteraceae bacterium]
MESPASPFVETREVAVRLAAPKLTPEQASKADRDARKKSRHNGRRGRDIVSHRYRNLFLEEAGRLLGDDCFGLHLAIDTDPREFGAIYYVFAASETAHEALANLTRYMRIVNSAESFSIEQAASQVTIEGKPTPGIEGFGRHMFEYEDAVLIAALRALTGTQMAPVLMEFDHHRTSSIDEFERFFGCPVRFGSSSHRLTFSAKSLEAPFRTADPYLLKFIRTFCEEALQRRRTSSTPLRAQAEEAVAELLPKGQAKVGNVAKALAMSTRTFNRRLAEEKTSYAILLDQLRRDLAMRYLEDMDLKLSQIAWLLGYTEVSSFNHAFRRWTGTSPKATRARQSSQQKD